MTSDRSQLCPLCQTEAYQFNNEEYYKCSTCQGISMAKHLYVDHQAEKKRYETHNNDVFDPRYRRFVSPITTAVLRDFKPDDKGLDFGAGTGPVISVVLRESGYHIEEYDPFFHPFQDLLKRTYDYIVCCEVIEHFHRPDIEFERLRKLLLPEGSLYCMTDILYPEKDFESWGYKNDPTHVFFYQPETFEWIKDRYGFSTVTLDNRLIQFK